VKIEKFPYEDLLRERTQEWSAPETSAVMAEQ
jgi:hypothetical protein